MRIGLVAGLAMALMVPAAATDTSSLDAFVKSCVGDSKGCHLMTLSAIHSARNAKYGCIPADVSDDRAADKLLDWLRDVANKDAKYAAEPLADLMWTGIDEVWPCKK
jgi:hypothetical protein